MACVLGHVCSISPFLPKNPSGIAPAKLLPPFVSIPPFFGISDVWNMSNGQDFLSIQLLQIIQGAIFVDLCCIHTHHLFFPGYVWYHSHVSKFHIKQYVYSIAFHIKLHSWGKEGGALGTSAQKKKKSPARAENELHNHHYHGNPQPSFLGVYDPYVECLKPSFFMGFGVHR